MEVSIMDREEKTKLILEFAQDIELNKITEMSKKMLKTLSVDELANIIACKTESTIMHIEKMASKMLKDDDKSMREEQNEKTA